MNTHLSFPQQTRQNNLYSPQIAKGASLSFFEQNDIAGTPKIDDMLISEVSVRHLASPSDVQEIQHLRGEINLALHRAIDPQFIEHEKKEMR